MPNDIYQARTPSLALIECAPLFAGHETKLGVYVCGWIGGSDEARFQPITLYVSRDGGVTYSHAMRLGSYAARGFLLASEDVDRGHYDAAPYADELQTGGGAGRADGWDNQGAATIQWLDGYVPTSTTEAEVLEGKNMLVVGSEVLQFKTATIASADTYEHSELLRGRRGTETEISSHTYAGDVFAVDSETFTLIELHPADIGRELYFKALTPGLDISDATEYTHTFEGRIQQPLAPCQVKGTRDASNNLTVEWTRRTRSTVRLMGIKAVPLGEDSGNYDIEILSQSAPYTVTRIIRATTNSATYTAAQQTTDGKTLGDKVNVRIYQRSDIAGRGIAGTYEIPANTGGNSNPTPNYKIPAVRLD